MCTASSFFWCLGFIDVLLTVFWSTTVQSNKVKMADAVLKFSFEFKLAFSGVQWNRLRRILIRSSFRQCEKKLLLCTGTVILKQKKVWNWLRVRWTEQVLYTCPAFQNKTRWRHHSSREFMFNQWLREKFNALLCGQTEALRCFQ